MNNITFGQYIKGNSWAHKMDPRMKILLTIALIVLIFLIPTLMGMLIATGVFLILFITAGISPFRLFKSIKGVIILLLFTVVLQLIYTKPLDSTPLYTFNMQIGLFQILIMAGLLLIYFFTKKFIKFKITYLLFIIFLGFLVLWKNPFVDLNWYLSWTWNFNILNITDFDFEIYQAGLEMAGYVFFRVILMISITSLLTFTTTNMDINKGLEWFLTPLKIFHKNLNSLFSMLIALTLRFIPTLLNESRKIMEAQASRGVDFNDGRLKDKVSQIISLLIPMFVISFKRADELSDAMEARGYIVGEDRTNIDLLKFRLVDYIALIVVLGFYTLVILNMVGIINV